MVCVDIGAGALDVRVESNGRKLEEYKLEVFDARAKQECYVASIADEEFRVIVHPLGLRLYDQRMDVYLDGVWAKAYVLNAGSMRNVEFQGALVTLNTERNFTFGKLSLKEDDSTSAGSSAHAELGTIRLTVQAVLLHGPSNGTIRQVKLPGEEAVSEKAKKAGSHAARLGATRNVTATFVAATPLSGWPTHGLSSSILVTAFPESDIKALKRLFFVTPQLCLDYLRARDIVLEPPAPRLNGANVKTEGETTKAETGSANSNSQAESSKKRAVANVIDISDDDDCETDGLTAEERAQYARLEAKRRAAGPKKEKRGSLTKKPKSEPGDPRTKSREVIDLSD